MGAVRMLSLEGSELADGQLGNLFSDAPVGSGVTYAWVQVVNVAAGPLTASRAWLEVDPGGAALALAVADGGTARAESYGYGSTPAIPAFGAVPTDYASGVSLPDLTPGQKCLLCLRRDTTSASVAYPERNALRGRSTGPA